MILTVLDWILRVIGVTVMGSCALLLTLALLAVRSDRKPPEPIEAPAPWTDRDFEWAEQQGVTIPESETTP